MIPNPRLPARRARTDAHTPHPLHHAARILDRHAAVSPHARLHHRLAEQPPAIASPDPQLLARLAHTVPLPLELELAALLDLGAVQLPRAVDRPVPEVAVAGEAEGTWHQGCGVVQVVTDECNSSVWLALAFLSRQLCRCRRERSSLP